MGSPSDTRLQVSIPLRRMQAEDAICYHFMDWDLDYSAEWCPDYGVCERGTIKMLREESLRFIRAVAGEFGAARVFLFGSCLSQSQDHAHDIDLAVEGISENRLDAFWDRLMWAEALGRKPVDVIRLEDGHWLNPIILDEGVLIYEEQLSSVAL